MATPKKAATKKTAAKPAVKKAAVKKAATKKAAPAAKAVIVFTAEQVVLNATQTKTIEMINRNQTRILGAAENMIKLATDSGKRLVTLQEQVKKQWGNVWKEWAQTEGNLPIGYEQSTRYMKLANNEQILLDNDIQATSIKDAVMQIEHIRKPEKKAAAEAKAAAKKSAPKPAAQKPVNAGIISNASLNEVEHCNDIEELRGMIDLCNARIEILEQLELDGGDDADDADDAADVAEQVGAVDPLS